jgi:hypothetical protein
MIIYVIYDFYAPPCSRGTVASRPKILQNNSTPAVEKSDWPEEFGGRTAAVFGHKRQKTGRKKYLLKMYKFSIHYGHFYPIFLKNLSENNFQNNRYSCLF